MGGCSKRIYKRFSNLLEDFQRKVKYPLVAKYKDIKDEETKILKILKGQYDLRGSPLFLPPTPQDILSFSIVRHNFDIYRGRVGESFLNNLLERLGVKNDLLSRNVYTLSGGESTKVSIAKLVLAWYSWQDKEVILVHPASWLDSLEPLEFVTENIPEDKLTIFLMEGEEDTKEMNLKINKNSVKLNIIVDDLCINLKETEVCFKKTNIEVASPVLVVGQNGVGKSVFFKYLVGIRSFMRVKGSAEIRVNGNISKGKMLLQNFENQIMLKSRELLKRHLFLLCYRDKLKISYESYEKKVKLIEERLLDGIEDSYVDDFLKKKVLLISLLLLGDIDFLVLDEPERGLSKKVVVRMLSNLINYCNENGIGIFIISHREDWWKRIPSKISFRNCGGEVVLENV